MYLAGATQSTTAIATTGSHQSSYGGGSRDAFLVKFNSNGIRQWGTYYGGSGWDFVHSTATDRIGNVYLAGLTPSTTAIATTGSHQSSYNGGDRDAFLVKFNSNGIRQWGTYYGGGGNDFGYFIATDGIGNVYLAGYTSSTTAIATTGSHQSSHGERGDAFLVKFNSSGVRQWGTYYGGSDYDAGWTIAINGSGNVYLAGVTQSTTAIATTGSHQSTYGGDWDAFLVKFEVELEAPTLSSPSNNAQNQELFVTLTWQPVYYATSYIVQVATNSNFENPIINFETTDLSYLLEELSYSTMYFWKVKARNSETESYWSEVWQFMTEKYKHAITLSSGWNMVSTYVQAEDNSLEEIFANIVESTVIVKNNLGQIYFPMFEINDIGTWDVKQGYQVYMSQTETLSITGTQVEPESTTINLSAGWNMLAYLRDNAMDIETALATLTADDNLVIAKDNLGNVYFPAFEINMIGDMLPGQGYQIYIINSDSFSYPEN